jgi:phosphoglucomutase
VLYFKLINGDVIVVRPSGTEPKIKFYFLLLGKDKDEVLAKLEGYKKTLEA